MKRFLFALALIATPAWAAELKPVAPLADGLVLTDGMTLAVDAVFDHPGPPYFHGVQFVIQKGLDIGIGYPSKVFEGAIFQPNGRYSAKIFTQLLAPGTYQLRVLAWAQTIENGPAAPVGDLTFTVVVGAVTPPPPPTQQGQTLAWDMPLSAATAQALIYTLYVDGAATGVPLMGVACSGAPTVCQAVLPPMTVGTHSVTLTASLTAPSGVVLESAKSAAATVVIAEAPPVPQNPRIIKSGTERRGGQVEEPRVTLIAGPSSTVQIRVAGAGTVEILGGVGSHCTDAREVLFPLERFQSGEGLSYTVTTKPGQQACAVTTGAVEISR